MINFSRLIDLDFIFNSGIAPMSENFVKIFYVLFGLCLVLSLASRLFSRQQEKKGDLPLKKFWQKLTTFFASLGILGLILLFFRQQHVYFLAMPLFLYLWFLSGLIWAIFIIRWALVKMKKMQKDIAEKKEREKYLP